MIDNPDIVHKTSSDGLSSLLAGLFSMQPEQFTLMAVVIGLILAQPLDENEQNSLGNFISVVGQTITTIAGQTEFLQSYASENSASNESDGTQNSLDINVLCEQLSEMKKRISELENKLEKSI